VICLEFQLASSQGFRLTGNSVTIVQINNICFGGPYRMAEEYDQDEQKNSWDRISHKRFFWLI